MSSRFPLYIIGIVLFASFFSCTDMVPTKEVRLIDSLNGKAYAYRYRSLDSSYKYANEAYRQVNFYKSGKAEASNNLGFCAFMAMDFDRAEALHKEVYKLTKNELELLIADIGLMKICQRTAMNKEFYDYRNSALKRMKRIREESDLFADRHEALRLDYAFTEFFIVSSIYYYYLQQRQEAITSLNRIPEDEALTDTNCFIIIILKVRLRWWKQPSLKTGKCVSSTNSILPGGRLFRLIILISKEMVCKDWLI